MQNAEVLLQRCEALVHSHCRAFQCKGEGYIAGNRLYTVYRFSPVHTIVLITVRREHRFSEIVERQCVYFVRKNGVLDGTVCSHDQQPCLLFIKQKEGSIVEMGETQIMLLLCLFCSVTNVIKSLFLRKSIAAQVQREHGDCLASWIKRTD